MFEKREKVIYETRLQGCNMNQVNALPMGPSGWKVLSDTKTTVESNILKVLAYFFVLGGAYIHPRVVFKTVLNTSCEICHPKCINKRDCREVNGEDLWGLPKEAGSGTEQPV